MSAVDARLAELAAAYDLPDPAPAQLRTILAFVAEDPTAPTTVTDPERAVDAHVADSLSGLRVPAVRTARRIADLGAGAGFPGLVLAAALPGARVSLVESLSRKCAFLQRVVDRVGLANAEVVCDRAESWREGTGACDVITARALAPLDVLAEYAAPLLAAGGHLVAWKGRPTPDEEEAGRRAAGVLGLDALPPAPVEPFPGAERHTLYVYRKVMDTPSRFPRRPGIARKRPLGTSS